MADVTSASIIPIPQPRPKTPAERARAYRARKKAKGPAPDRRPDFDLITEARPPVEVTVPVVTTDTTVTAPIAIKPRNPRIWPAPSWPSPRSALPAAA
jgi:hypothetical protein